MTASFHTQGSQELAKKCPAQRGRLADQVVSFFPDLVRAGISMGFQVIGVFGQGQPAIDQAFIEFEVALQAIGGGAVTESLVFSGL